ncbi:MAG TPA: hypothetical protein VMU94_00545 [Streptosporangiaceae bacterium]|nr:hypothetical protein [Streptosporangiaceae bacterium]
MDTAVTSVAMAALVADGIQAGLSLDKVIVQLPARRRIGVTAYAAYARAADLGNGIAFYAVAPAMFRIGRAGDDQAPLLVRFARRSAARTAAQTATLIVVAIAVR